VISQQGADGICRLSGIDEADLERIATALAAIALSWWRRRDHENSAEQREEVDE
jgi:hypothetical protein